MEYDFTQSLVRARAKALALDPLTLAYIERLEQVVRVAYSVWCASPAAAKDHFDDLYDALATVCFFDEEM